MNIPKYRDVKELLKEGKPYPDDFIYEGRKNSEIKKTEAQKKVLKFAQKVILERMENLGVDPSYEFDLSRVSFAVPTSTSLHSSNDFVLLRQSAEANVGTNIHELLHAYSSQYRQYKITKVDDYAIQNKKSVKSGFHINNYQKGFDNDRTATNFWQINEAVTEKITRELVDENFAEILTFKPLFVGRKEEKIKKSEIRLQKNIIDFENRLKKIDEDLKKDIEKLISENEQNIRNLDKEAKEKNYSDEFLENMKDNEKGFLESRIKLKKLLAKSLKHFEIHPDEMNKMILHEIEEDYSFIQDRSQSSAYTGYIRILDLILDGLAYKKSANKNEFAQNRQAVWEDLQKAYFQGKTVYLRKFDEIYDEKVLRFLDNISPISGDVQLEELANFLKTKNREFKNF